MSPPEESHHRFSATEVTNKTLAADMQELRTRLAEAEDTARTAERQRNQLQRLLQDFRRRLTPLQLEMQRMVEKVSSCERAGASGSVRVTPVWQPLAPVSRSPHLLHPLESVSQQLASSSPRSKWVVVLPLWVLIPVPSASNRLTAG